MRIIPAEEVYALATPRRAMEAVERAFLAAAGGELTDSSSLALAIPDASFHVKSCASLRGGLGRIFVAKVNSNFPANPSLRGLPTIQGVIAVFDAADGRLLALVDSPSVTNLRTAATSAVAIRHLAREGARVAAIVGCGVQGAAHADALAECMALGELRLFDTDAAKAAALAKRVRGSANVEVRVTSTLREATLDSHVVVTCTPSLRPFLGPDDVSLGTLVVAVGADNERKAEIEPDLLAKARVVVDSGGSASGQMTDVVSGRVPRATPHEVVVFDSTGLALEDLALCALLIQR